MKGGGKRKGGEHTAVRGTMFVRNVAVTPGPSCECATSPSKAFLLRDDQNLLRDDKDLRNNCVTVQWRLAGCRASPVIPGDMRMLFPQVKAPPV